MSTTLRNRFESANVNSSAKPATDDSAKPTNGEAKKSAESSLSGGMSFDLDQVAALQEKAEVFYNAALKVLEKADPYIKIATDYGERAWAIIEPYNPQELLTALYGLTLVFFGGIFMTLVASCEAVHIFGWPKIKESLMGLYNQWTLAAAAFERDNQLDEDHDGIADVEELTPQQLAARRLLVLSKAVDPEQVAAAFEGLTTAYVAVMATLRVKFAKAITLGVSIGNVLTRVLGPYVTETLKFVIPDEYEKWIPVVVRYGFRYVGVSISWFLMRITTGAFASIRGSSVFITGVCGYLVKNQYVANGILDERNPLLVGAWAVLAFFGWWWQISGGFQLYFPFNILLFPFTILENAIFVAVGVSDSDLE